MVKDQVKDKIEKEKLPVAVTNTEENQIKETEIKENLNEKISIDVDKGNQILGQENTNTTLHVIAIFGILLSAVIVLILILFLIFSFFASNNKNIYSGIYIKNVNVSNLNKEDAKNKVIKFIETSLPEEIVLTHGDFETTINTQDLNINFDIDSSINTAYNLGRDKNFITNGFDILSMLIINKNVEPNFTLDDEVLTNKLNDISNKLPDKIIESGYYIDGNNLIINKGSDGNIVDINKTKQKIKDYIKNLNIINSKIEINVIPKTPKELDINSIYADVHKDAVDAVFTKEPLSVTPSKNGIDFAISLEEAKSKLNEENKECIIPLKVVYPNFTTNMIGEEAFPDKLSDFSTKYAASNVNRTTNLRLAANKINGTVLMPGETFSYNQVVGERTIAAGYKEAPIYVSGRVEDGLGGGICQIATTLYNAAVYANLEIVERSNHQFVPSYIGAGKDATVVYGAIDFKFKNNRNYPIKIVCSVSSGISNFKILGLKTNEDYDVDIYSKITSQTSNSINSVTYKILKQNGQTVNEVLLSRDTYKRH